MRRVIKGQNWPRLTCVEKANRYIVVIGVALSTNKPVAWRRKFDICNCCLYLNRQRQVRFLSSISTHGPTTLHAPQLSHSFADTCLRPPHDPPSRPTDTRTDGGNISLSADTADYCGSVCASEISIRAEIVSSDNIVQLPGCHESRRNKALSSRDDLSTDRQTDWPAAGRSRHRLCDISKVCREAKNDLWLHILTDLCN